MTEDEGAMQLAVLSDLHLGAKDGLDRFARTREAEARLLRLLGRLERSVDRIVLLGDVFETLRGLVPGRAEDELRAAMAAYPEVSRRALTDPRYRWVHGNHDAVAARALGVSEFHELELMGTRYLFFHGHQVDRLARGSAPFSRLGVWLGGLLERTGMSVTQRLDLAERRRATRRHARRLDAPHRAHREEPAPDGAAPADAAEQAVRLGRARGADVIVNGHTHQAVRRELGDQVYLNSGTCLGGQHELLLLDTRSRRFEVVVEVEED
jgi:predicted phosphodiesterase